LGAERAINYRTEDFVDVVKQVTGGRGVDLILDIVGGEYIARDLVALAGRRPPRGHWFHGRRQRDDSTSARVLGRRADHYGLHSASTQSGGKREDRFRAKRREVWPLVERGAVKPVVYRTFPLEQAAAAHRLMESSEHVGKIILTTEPV
jgi:NADPH2:quinone reductase